MKKTQLKATPEEEKHCIRNTLILVALYAAAWLFGGYIKLILTIFLVPVLHVVSMFAFNLITLKYHSTAPRLKRLNTSFNIFTVLFSLLLPDAADTDTFLCFIPLDHFFESELVSHITTVFTGLAGICLVVSLVLAIVQIIAIRVVKRRVLAAEAAAAEQSGTIGGAN